MGLKLDSSAYQPSVLPLGLIQAVRMQDWNKQKNECNRSCSVSCEWQIYWYHPCLYFVRISSIASKGIVVQTHFGDLLNAS